jgi:sensor c-di-GMP phosphodiesterase-like protein
LQLYLDDFGVGYSSLSYIIRFAPHHLKIDRSFVAKIGTATKYDVMVEAIIGLSKVMPMKIIAEGVETMEQKEFLEDRGCNAAQGFLFSKALPEKEFLKFLKNYRNEIN